MTSVMIRVPLSVKEQLRDRAGGRPIYRMLQEDFLREPDLLKLVDTRFKKVEEILASFEEWVHLHFETEASRRADWQNKLLVTLESTVPGFKEAHKAQYTNPDAKYPYELGFKPDGEIYEDLREDND